MVQLFAGKKNDLALHFLIICRGEETLTVALCRSDSTTHLNQETAQYLATIVGDILFAKSSELMLKGAALSNSSSSVDIVLEAAIRAGGAQFEDILGWSGKFLNFKNTNSFEHIEKDWETKKKTIKHLKG